MGFFFVTLWPSYHSVLSYIQILQHTMTLFKKPYVTELKALTRQFRNCFSCFFSQQRQQVCLAYASVHFKIRMVQRNARSGSEG